MKPITVLLLFVIWTFQKVEAAAIPGCFTANAAAVQPNPRLEVAQKPTLLQRLYGKRLHKKLKKQWGYLNAPSTGSGRVVSTMALALAVFGVAALFIPSLIGLSLFLAIGALVVSIIGIAGKNRSKGAKIKSIIALVLSGLLLAFWVAFIIAWAGAFGGSE